MLPNVVPMIVVYFDQCLGAVHSKHWSEYAFSMYFLQKKLKKEEKAKKIGAKLCKKTFSVTKDNAFMKDRLAGLIILTALSLTIKPHHIPYLLVYPEILANP